MIYYTILFSLKKPEENWYFYMMMMLYKSLVRTESIGRGDKFFVIADADTIRFGKTFFSLKNVYWVEVPKPTNVKDGMLLKYMFRPKTDDVVVYLDSDFLAKKKLSFDLKPDTLAVLPEGPPTDSNYCGDGKLTAKFGASAGFFVYRYGLRTRALLDEIGRRTMECSKGFYTLDQPHFNAVIQDKECVAVINPMLVSFNGNGNLQEASLINCAGIPGDGEFHYKKMMDFFIML